jgi:hypothetical protein
MDLKCRVIGLNEEEQRRGREGIYIYIAGLDPLHSIHVIFKQSDE